MFPVTPAGRGIGAFLMVAGIALFGVLTANVAAFFVEESQGDADSVVERLDEILSRLEHLESHLDGESGQSATRLERRLRRHHHRFRGAGGTLPPSPG